MINILNGYENIAYNSFIKIKESKIMCSNNTEDSKIEGGSLSSFFKISNAHENIDPNIFSKH